MVASIEPMAEKKIREIKVPGKKFNDSGGNSTFKKKLILFFLTKNSVKSPELKSAQEMVEHMDWDKVSPVANFQIRDPHTSENQAE